MGSGGRSCALVAEGQSSAQAWQPPVWMWATLDETRLVGASPLPEAHGESQAHGASAEITVLDTETLHATLS